MTLEIREADIDDFDAIWPIFREVVVAGDTYGFDPETGRESAREIWLSLPERTLVAELDGQIVGTYYLKRNMAGPGSHVCNCGYMVPRHSRGLGVATAMCEHSQALAIELGYLAMQFNFVASSNEDAVALWERLGFEIVGRLPKAFNHPARGYVEAYIMYKWLGDDRR